MNGQTIVNASAGVFGAIFTFAFGGWTEALTFLVTVIAMDIVTGMSASIKEGRGLSSSVGTVGLAKKGLILLAILLAHRIDVLLELNDMVMGGAIYFYIVNELLSILENYGRHGLPLPPKLRDVVTILKGRGGNGDESANRP